MFEIDCAMLPEAVTDFAFDHLKGDVATIDSDKLELDYNEQVVEVDVGNMDAAYTVRDLLQERAYEKIHDLKFETEQGYNTGFEVNELQAAKSAVEEISVNT